MISKWVTVYVAMLRLIHFSIAKENLDQGDTTSTNEKEQKT
jgi:hypothetical protein